MSTTDTPLLAQLRAVLDLTHTEIQVAHMRSTQARTDAVRRELSEFADTARARAEALEDSIRELGGAPEVIGPFLGRPAAAVQAPTAQAQPFDEALLDDLALEHHLLDRARYIKILAITAQIRTVVVLADRLIAAHSAAADWLTTALAEHALGAPAALRRPPLQAAAGSAMRPVHAPLSWSPATWTGH
ncbi:hypothetical protein Pd630_LPD09121 (plasmid) [Rhodococcus opacus PD630]|nr:hypothetical protein Pd630_LPD09121 [Rhodococcus opacus PD630]UDH01655.1 hypothetical protein K2Z90_008082 [Rhodococcus opacus PD630]